MAYTQENRMIAIDTPLGKDVLLLAGFKGTEGISTLFRFELKLFSENHNLTFEDIIGKNVTISMALANGDQRLINGIIRRFSQVEGGEESGLNPDLSIYTATMVPWFWLLTQTSDSRIFQKMSVPEIVKKVFNDKGLLDFKMPSLGSYEKRDYCVQYQESDFQFVCRLLEDEGIYYFFEHEKGKHTLVLADIPEEHKACPYQETVRYHKRTGHWTKDDVITNLAKRQEITPGKYTHTDYSFKTPTTDLKVEVASGQKLPPADLEIYDYPGVYAKRGIGEQRSNVRIQELEKHITTALGSSVCRAFTSGYKFTLKNYYRDDMTENDFVLTSIEHEANEESRYLSRMQTADSAGFSYQNHFTCIPFDVPYRPSRITPKPIVQGTQTAIVTGPEGEEIYMDKHGRVKVQFHWDRLGNRNQDSSCWIRVGQAWAGAGWGAQFIPRIGQEVIVSFLNNNPDDPLIIGSVYHGNNKPPYGPGEKTKSTIKSASYKGSDGSNELRFEDKKGSEEIYLHGQKDWTIAIDNDKNQTVGNDETHSVVNNRKRDVGNDEEVSVVNNRKKSIGNDETVSITGNYSGDIGGNKTLTLTGNHDETISGTMSQKVSKTKSESITLAKDLFVGAAYQVSVIGAKNQTIGAAYAQEVVGIKSINVLASSSETVVGNKSLKARNISNNAGKDISEKAGKNYSCKATDNFSSNAGKDVSVKSGKKMNLNSGDDFGIKGDKKGVISIKNDLVMSGGKASITLKDNGDIIINGNKINIKGKGDIIINGKKVNINP